MFGKTIKLYLADGKPTGLRHVEITNWSGQAIACPRSRLFELQNWDETKRSGIYFLVSSQNSNQRTIAYVGESENVFTRLASHEKEKDFWNEVIIFTSKDENLTKGHIKYLEARIIEITKEVNRCDLENNTAPTPSGLPRSDTDSMEEFLVAIKMILGTLGHRFMEPIPRKYSDSDTGSSLQKSEIRGELLHFKYKNLKADGVLTDEGFIIYADSQITKEVQPSTPSFVQGMRDRLIAEKVLIDDGKCYLLKENILFNSPSQAASFTAGSSRNGRDCWKDKHNVSLKERENAMFEEQLKKL